ncbi:MAG: NAD-dependent epimerase/dehydratase family protein [Hyphomicrobiales bacterium]|nr:NAD-dependent epimerase/dehydratase family protein [Hyphomicrobiales bacterium]
MRVVITGAAGFLGQRLAAAICERGLVAGGSGERRQPSGIVLLDQVAAPLEGAPFVVATGDVCDANVVAEAVTPETRSVFHLAAVVSAAAEADFDLGMAVNLDATRLILERCREIGTCPRLVFVSSVAAFGGSGGTVDGETANRPLNSYGAQKAICELLINDYTRKGFVDGRAVRLPTIIVRPGRPNRAASSFASSILREPLNGERAICPVSDNLQIWVASPGAAVDGLMHAHDLAADALSGWRTFNLPGLGVTVREMVDALVAQGGDASLIDWQRDESIERIVGTWPAHIETPAEETLGFPSDSSLASIVAQYVAER